MNIGEDIGLIVAIVALFLLSGFFSISETGLMACNRYRLKHAASKGNRTANRLLTLLKRPERVLSLVLIGNTLANVVLSSIATFLAIRWWGNIGVAYASIIITIALLFFAETMPKTFAAVRPDPVAYTVAWPLSLLLWICWPFIWLMNTLVSWALLLFRIRVHERQGDHLNMDELRTLVYETGPVVPTKHRDMLMNLLDLERITVEDIMMPRNEIVGVNLEDDWEDTLELILTCQVSRILVYRGSIDKVVGVLNPQHILHVLKDGQFNEKTLLEHLSPPYFVPHTASLLSQLLGFQREKRRYALVVDEYGDIEGSVMLANIFEEVLGKFILDSDAVSEDISPQKDGSFVINASITLRELNKVLQWRLPMKGPKTLSGLIIEKLEDIPRAKMSVKIGSYLIEIMQVKDNRIKTVRVISPAK
ncbi:MAG: magnesium/cobalt efflux protein [Legionellaceae bacterium]|nr:magnesium/cobalt efflux protein [Legionellaceae bacterium]